MAAVPPIRNVTTNPFLILYHGTNNATSCCDQLLLHNWCFDFHQRHVTDQKQLYWNLFHVYFAITHRFAEIKTTYESIYRRSSFVNCLFTWAKIYRTSFAGISWVRPEMINIQCPECIRNKVSPNCVSWKRSYFWRSLNASQLSYIGCTMKW